MEVNGEITSTLSFKCITEYNFGYIIEDSNDVYLISKISLNKLKSNNTNSIMTILSKSTDSIFIGTFCKGEIVAFIKNCEMLELCFLNLGKSVLIPLPLYNRKNFLLKFSLQKFLLILVIDRNFIYQFVINENIKIIDENNINEICNGKWKFILALETYIKYEIINAAIELYDTDTIIFGPMFVVSFIYYHNDKQALFCTSSVLSISSNININIKIFHTKLIDITLDRNLYENFNFNIPLSFNSELPILCLAVNENQLFENYLIIFVNIICDSTAVINFGIKNNNFICNVNWDASGNFVLGLTCDGYAFCCTRFGYPVKINLFNGDYLTTCGTLISLFHVVKDHYDKIFSLSCGNNSFRIYFQGKMICFNISVPENIKDHLIKLLNINFAEISNKYSQSKVCKYVEILALGFPQSVKFEEFYHNLNIFVSNLKSLLGFLFSENYQNHDCKTFSSDNFDIFIRYISWLIKCLSSNIKNPLIKIKYFHNSFGNIFKNLLKLDSLWHLNSEALVNRMVEMFNILLTETFTDYQMEIIHYLLTAEIARLFSEEYLKSYCYCQYVELNIAPYSVTSGCDGNAKCVDSYYLPKMFAILENLFIFGNNLSDKYSEEVKKIHIKWKKWYYGFLSEFSSCKNMKYPSEIIEENYSHLLSEIIDEIKKYSNQDVKIYSWKCSKKLLSIIYVLIITGNLSECIKIIDIISTLKPFYKNSSKNFDFLELFKIDQYNRECKFLCMNSPVVRSIGRILAAYLLNKSIYISNPRRPNFIKSISMETEKGLTIKVNNGIFKFAMTETIDSQCILTINHCFDILLICNLYSEAIEVAYYLNNWKCTLVLLYISHLIEKLKPQFVNNFSTSVSSNKILEKQIELSLENLISHSNETGCINKLMEISEVRNLLNVDTLQIILEVIINSYMIPRVKSLSLFVSDEIYLPAPPLFSSPYCSTRKIVKNKDFDGKEIKVRSDLYNLFNIIWNVIDNLNILSSCFRYLFHKILSSKKLDEEVKNILSEFLKKNLMQAELKNSVSDRIQELFEKLINLIYYLDLRDFVSLEFRNRNKILNCKFEEWLDATKQLFALSKELLYFSDFLANEESLRMFILSLLIELKPDKSIIRFLVDFNFNEKFFQKFNLHSNKLLRKLLNQFQCSAFICGDNFVVEGDKMDLLVCQGNNLLILYYELLAEHEVSYRDNLEQFPNSRMSVRFMHFLDLLFSVKIIKSSTNTFDVPFKFNDNPIKLNLNFVINSLIEWSHKQNISDISTEIILNSDIILFNLT